MVWWCSVLEEKAEDDDDDDDDDDDEKPTTNVHFKVSRHSPHAHHRQTIIVAFE